MVKDSISTLEEYETYLKTYVGAEEAEKIMKTVNEEPLNLNKQ